MTTTQIQIVSAAVTAVLAILPLAAAAWLKLREVLAPLLQRRRLRVAILATEAADKDARAFLDSLRKAGYAEATITRSAPSCAGMRAVVLWCPVKDGAADLIAHVQAAAPEATVLVLTYEQLPVRLAPGVLLCNSTIRLRSDLSAVAEACGL